MGKAESLSLKIKNTTKMPTLTLFNIVLEVLATAIRQQKGIKVFKSAKKKSNCLSSQMT